MSARATRRGRGELRPHEPFDLIRLLARSQPDPRKAVAELVQNSLDAHARRVLVSRTRERGEVTLRIADDGEGVLPGETSRCAALEYLAQNIGHSRKHGLTIEQRRGALGRYGIGLLGFWSIGERLELRTRVRGGSASALHLREDDPAYEIEDAALSEAMDDVEGDPLREPTCTEVVVRGVHAAAMGALSGRRLSDFLDFELRGQIRERGVTVFVRDELARGRGARLFRVEPRALEGLPLDVPAEVPVEGHRPARLELRVLPESVRGGVALACEGAIVSDDLAREPSLLLDHAPWSDPRLGGVIDFPDLSPVPGSRRGIVPNRAAEQLRAALVTLEETIAKALTVAREAPRRELEREALERLRRVFVNLSREFPRYELLELASRAPRVEGGETEAPADNVVDLPGGDDAKSHAPGSSSAATEEPGDPDDLERVELRPSPQVVVAPGGSRNVTAIPLDGAGRKIPSDSTGALAVEWAIDPLTVATLSPSDRSTDGRSVRVTGGSEPATGTIGVKVTSRSGRAVEASVVLIVREPHPRPSSGVPDPVLVEDPASPWRTRVREGRWEVNSGHRDYRLVRDNSERRLQYLVLLFAKEIVHRSEGRDERLGQVLEAMAEVAAYALRQV